nr:ribonuclease H-like domain-containing protein [Tanacetum cinerariifolium]
MLDEYNALITDGTWVLVPRLANVNVVRSIWLFKQKFKADGSLSRYKARLVANEHNQQQDIDCDETFSLVVKPATICTVLSLAVSRNWLIHQLDVKNAFLHGHLFETVYMHKPSGFVDPNKPDYVCHLQRSLYVLEQASRAWFQCFASYATRHRLQHFYSGSLLPSTPCALQYLTFTRSDLSYVVQQLHVSSTTQLSAYTDADWAGCPVTRRSTSGAEAEYRCVANVVAENAWIRNLLYELHNPLYTVILVYCDNVSAVYMSSNPVQHQRTKHIEIDIYFVRDFVASRQVRVLHVPSRFQHADIYTTSLPTALFIEFRSSLNIERSPAHTEGEY